MSLLNVDDPLPQYLVVMLRLLVHAREGVIPVEDVRALLTPPSVEGRKVFDTSLSSLTRLGMVVREGDQITSVGCATTEPDDIVDALRLAVLTPDNNTGVGEDATQVGPRDLVRALCWFLTNDPTAPALGWSEVQSLQSRAIHKHLGNPIANDTRWNPFCSWSSALGFGTPALTASTDGSTAARLTPDCTTAVRRIVRARWQPGQSLDPATALRELRTALPVLPGGDHSRAVGLAEPEANHAGPALSFALLRGHDERWIRLEQDDDARSLLYLHDPDQPSFPRTFSSIRVLEVPRV